MCILPRHRDDADEQRGERPDDEAPAVTSAMSRSSRTRAVLMRLAALTAALAVGAVGAWAFLFVSTPAEDPLASQTFATVRVVSGEVGESIPLSTVAEWRPIPVGANRASGVVTSVTVATGAEVVQGAVLYTVDLRPVVIAEGDVPAFREITAGMSGADVEQVQHLLADLGFSRGEVDGDDGPMTAAAIRAWQKSLGVAPTGVVAPGDVIFVPSLPSRVALDTNLVSRGTSLTGGELVLSALPAAPEFSVPVTDAQAAMIPVGTRVEVTSPDGQMWEGFIAAQTRDVATGTVTAAVTGRDGTTVCGDQCALVPVTGQVTLASRIVTTETVAGLVVPSSAIVSGADGTLAVIDEAGERVAVEVIAAARGMSVVEGLTAGTRVRVPGEVSQ